ncbi:hypothetical protein ABZS76_05690 [Streptomyces sp. NPDC005562]|uniref:hypothetical protein n=1 Tax=Streptomyces sp. NPDC005562 TaxID=3154890 RepID=UPI0033B3B76B
MGRPPLVAASGAAVAVAVALELAVGVASGAGVVRGVVPTGKSFRCGTTAGTADTSGDRAVRARCTTGTVGSAPVTGG